VIGDDGDDYVTGYLGSDSLNGGGGSDYIYAFDGTFDTVFGGPQYDVCVVDFEDMVQGCEEIYRY
jgi:Ca2+-binding RTX toxin-like protein